MSGNDTAVWSLITELSVNDVLQRVLLPDEVGGLHSIVFGGFIPLYPALS